MSGFNLPVPAQDLHRLEDPGAISVVVGEGSNRRDYLVVRFGGKLSIYENACPHQGTPLETLAGRFFTGNFKRLLCSTHGAEFDPATGLCLKGPCKGKTLKRVAAKIVAVP